MSMIQFDGLTAADFSADTQRRTLTGVVVPWDKIGKHSNGRRWRFARGGLKYAHPKFIRLNDEHVQSAKLARAISAEETDEGLVMTFQVYEGPDGDRALALAAEGRKTGFSIEIEFDEADSEPDPQNPGVLLVTMAHLTGVAFVKNPAFTDARLLSMVANEEGSGMPEEITPEVTPAVETELATFTADDIRRFLESQAAPVERPAVVNPTASERIRPTAVTSVNEPVSYAFSWEPGGKYSFSAETEHDFSADLIEIQKAIRSGRAPGAALDRVDDFVKQSFADIEIADVPGSRINRHRPEMWTPQRDYPTPLWDLTGRGTVDEYKFDIPKFTSASGLVSTATEKTEPAGGSFVDEIQTITPTQIWGKAEITRQLWRSQGTPALSGILWDQFLRSFYEARETAIATFLNTLTAAADITLTGTPASTPDNDDDQVTVNDLEAALSDLNFARGGNKFTAFAAHQAIWRVLSRVKDDQGRPLYPIINPSNANGTSNPGFRRIDIAGTTAVPAYALGTVSTTATNSWLFDPAVVMTWASTPERLFWDFGATVQTANIPQLSFVTMGLYANFAAGNTDVAGVRQIIFDPSV